MKKPRPARRSASPFGFVEAPVTNPIEDIIPVLKSTLGSPGVEVAGLISRAAASPAYETKDVSLLCQKLSLLQPAILKAKISADVFAAMEHLFQVKVDDFLIAETVLFAKERDMLIGRYFVPVTDESPGLLSGFLSRWIESEQLNRLLHFFDFCKGANDPTFEYFLVFSTPAFHRVLSNKQLMRDLWQRVELVADKLPHPEWKANVMQAVDLIR
jgi:hypothetical protein